MRRVGDERDLCSFIQYLIRAALPKKMRVEGMVGIRRVCGSCKVDPGGYSVVRVSKVARMKRQMPPNSFGLSVLHSP